MRILPDNFLYRVIENKNLIQVVDNCKTKHYPKVDRCRTNGRGKTMTLNKSEWSIMEKLWEQPYTMMQLFHMLEEETGWSKSTVVTMLGRMVDKGLIAYSEGGRAREYYPLVKKEDVALSETKSLLDRVFKGSVNMMMSTLVKSNELSKDEINELQAILKKAGEKAD